MKLYELSQNYIQLNNMIEDLEDDSLLDTLESIQDEISVKVENIAKLMRNMDGDIEAIKTEEHRLAHRRRVLEKSKERLKIYVEDQLNLIGLDKVKTPTFTVAMQNNAPCLQIESDEHIPKKYWVEQEPKLDRKALLSFIKEGNELKGVSIAQTCSLRIR